MTLYLTDTTKVAAVEAAAASGFIKAFKLYPAGATTNSDSGVTDYAKIEPALRAAGRADGMLRAHTSQLAPRATHGLARIGEQHGRQWAVAPARHHRQASLLLKCWAGWAARMMAEAEDDSASNLDQQNQGKLVNHQMKTKMGKCSR